MCKNSLNCTILFLILPHCGLVESFFTINLKSPWVWGPVHGINFCQMTSKRPSLTQLYSPNGFEVISRLYQCGIASFASLVLSMVIDSKFAAKNKHWTQIEKRNFPWKHNKWGGGGGSMWHMHDKIDPVSNVTKINEKEKKKKKTLISHDIY